MSAWLQSLQSSNPAQYNEIITATSQAGDTVGGLNIWESETLAVFGQATYHASDDLRITAGLRWSDEEKDADLFVENTSTATGLSNTNFMTIRNGFFVPNGLTLEQQAAYLVL